MSQKQRWATPTILILITLALGGGMIYQQQRLAARQATAQAEDHAPLPADIDHNLSNIPLSVWNRVGTGGIRPLSLAASPSVEPRPTVLYIGAEYCPYCAALKWALVAALNRFGTFNELELSMSSAHDVFPLTPTLTFVHAGYQSPYIIAQTVEARGETPSQILQLPTQTQATLLRQFDPPGSIPFLLIGSRYVLIGSSYSPALLQGADWHAIAAELPAGATPTARAILGAGNEISAAICLSDGMRPTSVCRSKGVQQAIQTTSK